MTTAVTVFLLAFVFSVPLNLLSRAVCRRFGLVDHPDEYRKLHRGAIPLSGGYAILAGSVCALVGMYLMHPDVAVCALTGEAGRVTMLALCVVIVLAMGIADDVMDLRPRHKLLFQLIAATLAYASGVRIGTVTNPFGVGQLDLGLLSYPATVFWFLACMNAINLIDGLDGLAGGVSLFACVTMALVSHLTGNQVSMYLCACLGGAILGFLLFNFHPASVFLGDAGSMTLGFLIGALSLMGSVKTGAAIAMVVPIVALGLPAFDTALAIARRWAHRLPVGAGDHRHIHHVLLARGLSPRGVVLVLYTVCLALGGAALLLTLGRNTVAFLVLAVMGVLAFVFIRVFSVLDLRELRERILQDVAGKANEDVAAVEVEKTLVRIDKAEKLDDVWAAMIPAFEALNLQTAECQLLSGTHNRTFAWTTSIQDDAEMGQDACILEVPVRSCHGVRGLLRLRRIPPSRGHACALVYARRLQAKVQAWLDAHPLGE